MRWNREHAVKTLGGIAAVLTIVAFGDTYLLEEQLVGALHTPVTLPAWTIVVAALVMTSTVLLLWSPWLPKAKSPESSAEITALRKESAISISSDFLKSPQGSLSVWVALQPFGRGIRKLQNNRYIFAHDTNRGEAKDFDGDKRYVNVVALSRGPRGFAPPRDPLWRLWIANGEGKGRSWTFSDSEAIESGWHHFLLRWDHDKALLEFLLDGQVRATAGPDYGKFWPTGYDTQAFVGSWSSLNAVHFIDTRVARVFSTTKCVKDQWVSAELASKPSN